jgi:hypothetical protein
MEVINLDNKDYIYKIKRLQSVKDADYDEESYRKAIESVRIKGLMKTGNLCCELEHPLPGSDIMRISAIDPTKVCGRILEIDDEYITVKLFGYLGEEVKQMLDLNENYYKAAMRMLYKTYKTSEGKNIIDRIITFDIVLAEYKIYLKERNKNDK